MDVRARVAVPGRHRRESLSLARPAALFALDGREEATQECLDDGRRLGVHLQFQVDILQVKRHGIDADAQRPGGGLVVVSLDQQSQ
jgi:hypothetical protein